MTRAYSDTSMELHRKLNPDWRFSDPATFLLSEMASMMSDLRYFATAEIVGGFDDVPVEYLPAKYGPPSSEPEPPRPTESAIDRARQVAAEIRAGCA